jgi:outer membrane protein assembly factor BamB
MKTARYAALSLIVVGLQLMAADTAPLGSPDFYPSPEHPIGFRGDGTGRFPGATPPAVWNRRVAAVTSEIMVQAGKPKGQQPGPDSRNLAYFTIKDWLVAGPFPAADPAKDIDADLLGGEAEVQPDIGMKAGNTEWKVFRACEASQSRHDCNNFTCSHMWVDLVKALGSLVPPAVPYKCGYGPAVYADLEKQAAYAHTYLFAPREADADIDIVHDLPAVKIWVNGAPQSAPKQAPGQHKPLRIHLNAGWNRLLVKAICDQAQNKQKGSIALWRFAAYVMPAGGKPNSPATEATTYQTKNVSWMTKLTGRCASQPIVVGDKVFVGSGTTDLLCLERTTGKILWMHTGTYWDAMTPEERAAVQDKAGPLVTGFDKANAELVALLNANITSKGLDSAQQALIDKKLAEREKLVKPMHDALATGSKGKLYFNEVSPGNATPASDGKQVYWMVQGNGGFLTSAFDLNGKLVWSHLEQAKAGAGEHGSHRSPALCDGKLLAPTNDQLVAYDCTTGKELWRTAGASHQHGIDGNPILVQFNGKRAVQTSKNLVGLDGEVLAQSGYQGFGCYVPVVEDGVLYNSVGRSNGDHFVEAIQLPQKPGGRGNRIWLLDGKTLYGPLGEAPFQTASPLYVDGLLYQVDMYGHLAVIDTQKKELAFQRWMDGYNWNNRFLYGYCASPTLAGKNVYLLDDAGYMTILKPGAEGTIIGQNVLENQTNLPGNGPCRQEVFYAGMFFHGKQLFLHGDEYLYCIEEK